MAVRRRRRRRRLRPPCLARFIALLLYLHRSFALPITPSLSLSLSLSHYITLSLFLPVHLLLSFSISLRVSLSLSPPSVSAIIWVSRFSDYEIAHECPLYARVIYAQYTRPEICAIYCNIKKCNSAVVVWFFFFLYTAGVLCTIAFSSFKYYSFDDFSRQICCRGHRLAESLGFEF